MARDLEITTIGVADGPSVQSGMPDVQRAGNTDDVYSGREGTGQSRHFAFACCR